MSTSQHQFLSVLWELVVNGQVILATESRRIVTAVASYPLSSQIGNFIILSTVVKKNRRVGVCIFLIESVNELGIANT